MIYIGAIIAVFIFAYMRNKQANRNDKRRERLWQKQVQLNAVLHANKKEADSNQASPDTID